MPVRHYDHGNFIAGMPVPNLSSQSTTALRQFYLSLMGNLSHVTSAPTTPDQPAGLPFTDVAESRWSYSYIKEMYDAGVINGMTATTFAPAANVTRAQFVTMIARLADADVSGYASGPFADVPAGSWYAPYVNWAAANGIVNGTSATTFDPNTTISRQDMAVMLYNYTQHFGVQLDQKTVTAFTDEGSIAAYALPAVQALHRAALAQGEDMADNSDRHMSIRLRYELKNGDTVRRDYTIACVSGTETYRLTNQLLNMPQFRRSAMGIDWLETSGLDAVRSGYVEDYWTGATVDLTREQATELCRLAQQDANDVSDSDVLAAMAANSARIGWPAMVSMAPTAQPSVKHPSVDRSAIFRMEKLMNSASATRP